MNIYVRLRDYDLFKYLDDSEMAEIMPLCESRLLASGDWLNPAETMAIVILQEGKMERISNKGKPLGELSAGEIDLEAGIFCDFSLPYRLLAATEVRLLLFPYTALDSGLKPEIMAKLQAAINDCLCLKTVRLTHLGADDDSSS
jgi:hypothetical protein